MNPSRAELIRSLTHYARQYPDHAPLCSEFINLASNEPKAFLRTCFPAHFTASSIVITPEAGSVLLLHHKKLNRWLQPGGHADGDENLLNVALRELAEETGVDVSAAHLKLPIHLDRHLIPASDKEPSHSHYDVRYLVVCEIQAIKTNLEESNRASWFNISEIDTLGLDDNLLCAIKRAAETLRSTSTFSA